MQALATVLSLFNDNLMLSDRISLHGVSMMLGCGYCEKTIHGRPYLYFWHYETRGGRREQVEEYVGPARSPRSREETLRRLDAYVKRAHADLARLVRRARAELLRR